MEVQPNSMGKLALRSVHWAHWRARCVFCELNECMHTRVITYTLFYIICKGFFVSLLGFACESLEVQCLVQQRSVHVVLLMHGVHACRCWCWMRWMRARAHVWVQASHNCCGASQVAAGRCCVCPMCLRCSPLAEHCSVNASLCAPLPPLQSDTTVKQNSDLLEPFYNRTIRNRQI